MDDNGRAANNGLKTQVLHRRIRRFRLEQQLALGACGHEKLNLFAEGILKMPENPAFRRFPAVL
jgi:hypothetical protein